MEVDKIGEKMAQQLDLVLDRAREIFVDLLEHGAREAKIGIGAISEPDKRYMERLFSEVVKGHIIAEAAAIISFLIYIELQDKGVQDRIVPGFLDKYDSGPGPIAGIGGKDIGGVMDLANSVLNSEKEKSEVVTELLQDIAAMAKVRPMRATFDAVFLALLGE